MKWSKLGVFCPVFLFGLVSIAVAGTAGSHWTPEVWRDYLTQGPKDSNLPDFSTAGYRMGASAIPDRKEPIFSVMEERFGAVPDDGRDDTIAIQKAIDAASQAGGGVVFLPRGRYEIRKRADAPYLRIEHGNVVVRGEGSDENGTVLHLCSRGPEGTVRRLGTTEAKKEPRSGATLAIIGNEKEETLAHVAGDARRGAREITVDSTAALRKGMQVVLHCTDPSIDKENPRPEKSDLVQSLTTPYVLQEDQVDTFGLTGREITWITRIEEILDDGTVLLAKPLRFDLAVRYQPTITTFGGLSEVGIEDLRITSRWQGGYRHHKPFTDEKGNVIRTAREQDYLWNGIWISHLTDGWVKNVAFENLTQGLIVVHSADLSVEDVRFFGKDGHAGITIARSNDVLVRGADFYSRLVHPVTLSMMASGNVITGATSHAPGRDEQTDTDTIIDFHGMFPFENLFDDMHGFYICPGGDLSVLPHAGVRNVFWNIEAPQAMTCFVDAPDEFARTWAYNSTSAQSKATMAEHFPQAFYIGIHRQGGRVALEGSSADRRNKWMTVEGLNREDIAIPSLYKAQRDNRYSPRYHEKSGDKTSSSP